MVQILTVCRIGAEWGFRDVTGASYGISEDIRSALDLAERMAHRLGCQVSLTSEAREHLSASTTARPLDSPTILRANRLRRSAPSSRNSFVGDKLKGSKFMDESRAPDPRDWLAAIIDGSDDAIVSKNLNGIIQSWNGGAERLFGYEPSEVIGKSVTILIPQDRLDEEPLILKQIQEGKRVDHFETKRRRKDGSLLDISLTISPIRNESGVIVGASKIARDITERLLAQEQQQLLMGEMRHRVKNLFALAKAIVSISARSTATGSDIIANIQARMSSLARAHDLILSDRLLGPSNGQYVPMLTLIGKILEPYATEGRIHIWGDDCEVGGKAVTNLSLLLHELATNAAKHGSLSSETGRLEIGVVNGDDQVSLRWQETGGPSPSPGRAAGFGTRIEGGLAGSLGATIERDWQATGLVASITLLKTAISAA